MNRETFDVKTKEHRPLIACGGEDGILIISL